MKTRNLWILLLLVLTTGLSFSQSTDKSNLVPSLKNQIGIQFNPAFDNNGLTNNFIYGVRYSYRISKPITLGTEISGLFPNRMVNLFPVNTNTEEYKIKFAIYARYSFFTERRIQGFMELSPYYMDYSYNTYFESDNIQLRENGFKLYFAPGISLYSKNRKYSLDLYYKVFVPTPGLNERSTFSYKLNLHF